MSEFNITSRWFNYDLNKELLSKAFQDTRDRGVSMLNTIMNEEFCDKVANQIDELSEGSSVEINYGGSEHRIWNSHKKSIEIDDFFFISNRIMSGFLNKEIEAHNVLAYRNRPVSEKEASLIDGRWHLDSLRDQFKVFVFLKDVESVNGPLQFITKTNNFIFKLNALIGLKYISPFDISGGNRRYQKLKDEWIEKLFHAGYEAKDLNVKKGTIVLINTSSIHRAKPCETGSRYALCSYYR